MSGEEFSKQMDLSLWKNSITQPAAAAAAANWWQTGGMRIGKQMAKTVDKRARWCPWAAVFKSSQVDLQAYNTLG